MKKVLFLINTLCSGGAEKVLADLVNNLPCDKYDITLQTVDDRGVYQKKLKESVHYKTINKKEGLIGRLRVDFLTYFASPKYIYNKYIKGDYDIEIAFLEGLPTKIISRSTNKKSKKIAWVHIDLMSDFGSLDVYRNFHENKKAYEKFDRIACVSDDVKDKFIMRFGDIGVKTDTVYNIVLDDEIREKGNEGVPGIAHDAPVICGSGRLSAVKGFDRLLNIHKRLINEGIKNYLMIMGEGELKKQFEDFICENNLSDTATLLGYKENPYKYMKQADLFVCSSLAEGFSTVITESVILGVPVASTCAAGAKEPKEHVRCYKITENNEESLYIAIKELLTNKNELRKAKEYTKSISGYFKKEIYLKNIVDFLENV